jgi:hypothetical protein
MSPAAPTPVCTRRHPAGTPALPVVPGTELCQPCHNNFRVSLTGIAELWDDLRRGEKRATDAQDVGFVQTSGHQDVGDMWRPQVTQVSLDITDFAAYLARLVRNLSHGLTNLTSDNPVVTLHHIERYHARTITQGLHDGLAAAVVSEAWVLYGRAQRALDAPFLRRIALPSTCAAEVTITTPTGETADVLCGGQLYAVLATTDSGRHSEILCTHDPRSHRIRRDQWLALADTLDILDPQVVTA